MKIGSVETALVLDTGSADLWVISDACTGNCSTQGVPLYPQATFQPTGLDARLLYGDSSTGTHAYGPIGTDTVGLAGLTMEGSISLRSIAQTRVCLRRVRRVYLVLGFLLIGVSRVRVLLVSSLEYTQRHMDASLWPNTIIWIHQRKARAPLRVPAISRFRTIQNLAIRFFPKSNFLQPTFPTFPDSLRDPAHSRRQSVLPPHRLFIRIHGSVSLAVRCSRLARCSHGYCHPPTRHRRYRGESWDAGDWGASCWCREWEFDVGSSQRVHARTGRTRQLLPIHPMKYTQLHGRSH
jgi:hypothetical protein